MRKKLVNLLVIGCSAAMLGACGGIPDIEDVVGSSSRAPDERQVPVHQLLAMPPDYQLRPPADGSNVEAPTNPYALPHLKSGGAPALAQPAQTGQQPAQPGQQPAQVASADPNATGPQTLSPAQADPNTVHGISKVNADGTPKSQRQIRDELKKKQLEAKRKKNPNYGTIWNIGSLFSDW